MHLKVWPDIIKGMKEKAATLLQRRMRGYYIRKRYWHEISINRMNNCFDFFKQKQIEIETAAIRMIIYYWRKLVAHRKELELKRQLEEKKANPTSP